MIRLALATTLSITACAPVYANPTADAALQMCNGFTQVVKGYIDSGMTRQQNDELVNAVISNHEVRNILMGMLDIADEGEYEGFMLELKVHTHCIKSATSMIVAAR